MGNQNYTDIIHLVENHTDITHLVKKAQKNEQIKGLLETSLRLTLLIETIVIFSLLLILYRNQVSLNLEARRLSSRSQVLGAAVPVMSVHLIIPTINVNADIQSVGVTSEGTMEVPDNIADVGWFKLGPRPGEKGSAVISGHVDGANGEAAVFANLYKLKAGDKLYVEDDKGTTITFRVRESRTYDPGHAEEVFSQSDKVHLNLITCDGVWDGVKKSYSKRLVVFADITN